MAVCENTVELSKKGPTPWFDNCTGHCDSEPHTCDCDFMNGRQVFLTERQRKKIEKDYYSLSPDNPQRPTSPSPYEPWVVETWRKESEKNGYGDIASSFRKNLSNAFKT